MDTIKKDWIRCTDFHGHECGGLTIGFMASYYAKEILGLDFSQDEDVVCVTENDACGVDAIQVLLGCSVGKGNLIFRIRGKQAFSFYNRKTQKSVRLVYKNTKKVDYKQQLDDFIKFGGSKFFEVKETTFVLPEKARIFNSIICEKCGENTAESMIKIENGKKVCMDCADTYTRFY